MFAQGSRYHRADHFYKNARKTLAFSGCFIRFTLNFMLWGVAGATRQYFMYDKIRSCFLSEFSTMPSMIPCTLCVHLLVSSEYPAYAVYSPILCRQKPAHGLSFFFLPNAKHSCVSSSFFLERRKKNAERKIV